MNIKSKEIGVVGKIIIPKDIQNTIDYLHKSIGAIEWSGILFYKLTKGDINTLKDLEFTAKFIFPMNIGSHTYTEFDYSGEVMGAYDVNEELIECSSAMIHTHHSMSAFFSGTDTEELLTNCTNFNYYISLIVNFSREYKCKIAFPSKTKTISEYTIRNSEGEFITSSHIVEESNIIVGELIIDLGDVQVEKWLEDRITVLKEAKIAKDKQPKTVVTTTNYNKNLGRTYKDLDMKLSNTPKTDKDKQFLISLMNLNTEYKNESLESTLVGIEVCGIDLDSYSLAIWNNIEIIHDDLYGNNLYFSKHCENAMKILENNKMLFSDELLYDYLYETLEANV